ncbi:MAG: DUF2075 domain-containing protein [Candidatus Thermoplasmatota archaeon]|nr:DUF2075 domain-containing protein [Candidatus Thermoplasmatota archaeon]
MDNPGNCLYLTDTFRTDTVEDIVSSLSTNYSSLMRERPDSMLTGSWIGSIKAMKSVIPDGVPTVMEYIFPIGRERLDYMVIGKKDILLIETKGWRDYSEVDRLVVKTDIGIQPSPCYQSSNYLHKFLNFHTAGELFNFHDVVFMYNTRDGNECTIYYSPSEFSEVMRKITDSRADQLHVDQILKGKFVFNKTLIDFISNNRDIIMQDPLKAFAGSGYGLSSHQIFVLDSVLEAIASHSSVAFLVRGKMGSGKTLLALNIILEAVKKGHFGLLTYRNNRLINTMRRSVPPQIRDLIKFYSTGPLRNNGVGESLFNEASLGKPLEFVVFDEAQRMAEHVIGLSMKRSPVSVFFYDENQILIGDEAGTRDNFVKYARDFGKTVVEFDLESVYRNISGNDYSNFVDALLSETETYGFGSYDLRIFDNISEMLSDLESFRKRKRVALVASFTESDGTREKVRYREPRIEWLMDPSTEYPPYWIEGRDSLKKCASVYGSQGFETDIAGFIWGRDFVWRSGQWKINASEIMDKIGGKNSLRNLAAKNDPRAVTLMKNRYRILLTRGIEGTYIFCEDKETGDHLRNAIELAGLASRSL